MGENTWRTPRLVALVRGRPEEAILQACKDGTIDNFNANTTPINGHAHCVTAPSGSSLASNLCTQCQSLPSS